MIFTTSVVNWGIIPILWRVAKIQRIFNGVVSKNKILPVFLIPRKPLFLPYEKIHPSHSCYYLSIFIFTADGIFKNKKIQSRLFG